MVRNSIKNSFRKQYQYIVTMHWYHLPKVKHNEDAVREYERGESQRLGRWVKCLVIALPFTLLIGWLILHK